MASSRCRILLYDEVRPRYPEESIEHSIALPAPPVQAQIFEVDCQAPTLPQPNKSVNTSKAVKGRTSIRGLAMGRKESCGVR
jgi:hypothetical protein